MTFLLKVTQVLYNNLGVLVASLKTHCHHLIVEEFIFFQDAVFIVVDVLVVQLFGAEHYRHRDFVLFTFE
jgi:hypothetical protein